MRLLSSVTTYNNLPLSSNFIGDIRKTIDTGYFYIWMSQDSSGLLANWELINGSVSGDNFIWDEDLKAFTKNI